MEASRNRVEAARSCVSCAVKAAVSFFVSDSMAFTKSAVASAPARGESCTMPNQLMARAVSR